MNTQALTERFWGKVDQSGDCWLWTGATNGRYGKIRIQPRPASPESAHRVVYKALVGPIPDSMTIDHLCRQPLCVNPAHLEVVTFAENMRRARRTHCQNGHDLAIYGRVNQYDASRGHGNRHCSACRRIDA